MRRSRGPDKVEQQMTPMIDIVFQLLAFFVMTFRITSVEGDFDIKMPPPSSTIHASPPSLPALRVALTATPGGELAGIALDGRALGTNFAALHGELLRLAGTERGPNSLAESLEVELDCDYALHYANVVKAITAISGSLDANGHVVKLIDKIKFSSPRRG